MPIDATHPEYNERQEQWMRSCCVFEGEDAVKAEGVKFLPALGELRSPQDIDDYNSYKTRAEFVNFLEPTIRGIVGLIMAREPVIQMDEALKELIEDDMTLTGLSMREWIGEMLKELLKTGRVAYLVDYSKEKKRPYVTSYTALQYTNWSPDFHVFKECYIEAGVDGDPYKQVHKTRFREVALDKDKGAYITNVWKVRQVEGKGDDWYIDSTSRFLIRGKNLTEFPVVVASATGDLAPSRPPLIDLVNVNLSHYRTSADLEHGRHFTALPTPWTDGLDPEDPNNKTLRVGSMNAWLLPTGAKCGYLEFSGAGLSSLTEAKKEKAQEAALLGAQLLMEPHREQVTADTARIQAGGKSATLLDIVFSAEAAIEEVLEKMAEFAGIADPEVEVKLNRQFFTAKLSSQELDALKNAFIAGTISYEVYFWNLQNGLFMPPDRTLEEEKQALEDSGAPKGPLPTSLPPPPAPNSDGAMAGEGDAGGSDIKDPSGDRAASE